MFNKTYCTAGVNEEIANSEEFAKFVLESIRKFNSRDWGTCGDDSKQMNDRAAKAHEEKDEENYDRILAVYESDGLPKIWIIREYDASATTILFPSEY